MASKPTKPAASAAPTAPVAQAPEVPTNTEAPASTEAPATDGNVSPDTLAPGDGPSNQVFRDLPETDRQQPGLAGEGLAVYQVTSVPIRHDGDFHGVGSLISLSEDDAARLGSLVAPIP